MVIVLTLLLSGCKIDSEDYYRNKAFIEGYELEIEIVQRNSKFISVEEYYIEMLYRESYKEEFIFDIAYKYARCNYKECEFIQKKTYDEVIEW